MESKINSPLRYILLIFSLVLLTSIAARAQAGREVDGTVIDSTQLGVPGAGLKLISDKGDSTVAIADAHGKFAFGSVHGTKITITITSIGYVGLIKHFTLTADNKTAVLPPILLKTDSHMLQGVTIVGVNAVVLKEDTVEYKASAYKVRDNAPVEDLIKKLPGVDVDVNGNVTTQGKQVTKVRINGKDFMGGDVQSATKNLPADIVENIQMIDDYGDQANLTGIKTGEPDKIMNITIRKDRNYGYSLQATGGDGGDALPAGQADQNRYLGTLNSFRFNGDQQMALLGSINNTNVNTFSFGSNNAGGGGFGGGGGRGNAGRGGGGSNGSLTTSQNGLTNAHSIGANFRDQWGKALSVYGSYSFADNNTNTTTTNLQENLSPVNPSTNNQQSNEIDKNINHRFTWNMEYKPDTINYLKVTPNFSYSSTNSNDNELVKISRNNVIGTEYNSISNSSSTSPTYGFTGLYNRRLGHRRNLSFNFNISSSTSDQNQNPTYNYTIGVPNTPTDQMINTHSRTTTIGGTLSYIEPLGKTTYLELNYNVSHSSTVNVKATDTTEINNPNNFSPSSTLSTNYNYTFNTERIGLNFREVQKKYNLTLGLAALPATLDGFSPLTDISTHINTFNFIPTARYVYNFSRSQLFTVNYNGSSSSPSYTQLQPVPDYSNAAYPVEGNPNLKPQFTNNLSLRYNNFSFATGNIFFVSMAFSQINNQVVTNSITYANSNTVLTKYLNADGYYTINGNLTWAKPWDNRKYTLSLRGNVSYANNVGYLTDSTATAGNTQKNIGKNLQFTPQVQFRIDITDVIDAQFLTNYAINRTSNSVNNPLTNGTSNIRTWNLGLNGKQYILKDWTFSYDYSKAINYGYSSVVNITNPNILNVYLERRFLKHNQATIRLSAFDLFNQNTGFSSSTTASSFTETNTNRLSRYYLATFTLRLQKFAGKAPTQNFDRGNKGDGGGGRRPGGGPPGGD